MKRLVIHLQGTVQGVGFRPFVYRIAKELGLGGYVLNNSEGVTIEVEGDREKLEKFLLRLNSEKPPLAHIYSQSVEFTEPAGYRKFEIRESIGGGKKEVLILPDIATCRDCLRELFNSGDRRYLYPFINCTNCGPRYTIIESLPYDRPNTSMKVFQMCPECLKEYQNPTDRRFHAQPNACPECGPHVSLYTSEGHLVAEREEAIGLVIEHLREGKIVSVKGIGGFHLICDATNEESVKRLRERKRRAEKPFAVMFKDIRQLKEYARPTTLEEALLMSPERPIVLIEKKRELAPSVAPGLRRVGAFLPYSPLHHILLRGLEFPLVATSGNLSEEPIIKDNEEALKKLAEFSDYLLLHNREILRRCDDSVLKVIGGIPTPIRRSRGYAPLPVEIGFKLSRKVLAVGGMLKNTFAVGMEDRVILSQHIGDVENLSTLEAFLEALLDLMKLYEFHPDVIVCDLHPRYETTRFAKEFSREKGIPLLQVQHHYAHILSCMAENEIENEVLGIAWDGTGYGEDSTLWGGEFLIADYRNYRRAYHFRYIKLIGGEKAIREPYRVALSILFDIYKEDAFGVIKERFRDFPESELKTLYTAWEKGINSPLSSSVGRLFDALASILNIKHRISYEGQAAMMIEDMYEPSIEEHYPFRIEGNQIDLRPTFTAILGDGDLESIPTKFINTLAHICLEVSKRIGIRRVCLSGGVMQNSPLVARIKSLLSKEGFEVYTHQKVPPNDGGISLGQAVYGGVRI